MNTARTHLKRIFSKTSIRSQAELIKMVMLNPALTMLLDEVEYQERRCLLAKLASGRTLSYAEYGDPDGIPVLFCHAATGCRLMIPTQQQQLKRQHIRLIVPDRAGYGESTPATCSVGEQWLQDMQHFTAYMRIEKFDLIGHSAGSIHAMSLVAAMPQRIRSLTLISGVAPLYAQEDIRELLPVTRMSIHLCQSLPHIARPLIQLSLQTLAKSPESYFTQVQSKLPESDRQILSQKNLKEQLIQGFAETTKQGTKHLVDEMLYLCNEWNIEPEQLQCPVTIWHGLSDKHSPAPLMQRFADKIPNCKDRHWLADQGHYLLFKYWDDIISSISTLKH